MIRQSSHILFAEAETFIGVLEIVPRSNAFSSCLRPSFSPDVVVGVRLGDGNIDPDAFTPCQETGCHEKYGPRKGRSGIVRGPCTYGNFSTSAPLTPRGLR